MCRNVIWLAMSLTAMLILTSNATAAMTYEGKVIVVENQQIGIIEKDGDSEQFDVAESAKINLNGKPAQLDDIEVGDVVKLTVEVRKGKQVAVIIEARDRE